MKFTPSKAIQIPVRNGIIDQNSIKNDDWWKEFDTKIKNDKSQEKVLPFREGRGCYIFSIKKYGKITPWYVGKTQKQTFEKECFHYHKFAKYSKVFMNQRGTPMLTLIAKVKDQQLGLSTDTDGISVLEKMLIRICTIKNNDLSNVSTASKVKNLQVEGFTVWAFPSKKGRRANRVIEFSELIKSDGF